MYLMYNIAAININRGELGGLPTMEKKKITEPLGQSAVAGHGTHGTARVPFGPDLGMADDGW